MGKCEPKERKGGFLSFIFKIIFCVVFIILGLLTTLFTITYLGYQNNATAAGWSWAEKIPFVTNIYDWIKGQSDTVSAKAGMGLILIGLDVSLIYFGIMFIIKKIPFIGKIIRWLTGIIPTLGILAIIIGIILLVFL